MLRRELRRRALHRRELLRRVATWAAAVVGLEADALPASTGDALPAGAGDALSSGAEDAFPAGTGDALGNDSDDSIETETAVVDRIEDGRAVVLFEASGRQRTVPAGVLPPAAREAGTVLRVPDGRALALAEVDRAATRERRRTAQDRFDELAERPDDG